MAVGDKRFVRVVRSERTDIPKGEIVAEFAPFDMGAPRRFLTHDEIQTELAENNLANEQKDDREETAGMRAIAGWFRRTANRVAQERKDNAKQDG